MKATLSHIRVTPKKANLVAELVRNKSVSEALDILRFTTKKTAPILKKLILSAVANAENNDKQNRENLTIQTILVTAGPTYKRSMPVSRGRSHPILKRTSHIKVMLKATKPAAAQPAEQKIPSTTTTKKPQRKTAKPKEPLKAAKK